jgi:predicted pyridoxine 5'-phosphate oxidase superfamily flavin-nucleotide-binding protein
MASRAEVQKLARLDLDERETLENLSLVPARELRAYREAVVELLYEDSAPVLKRAADAARLLPARLLATIGQRALGPLTCARLTGLIDPERAAEIAEHFSTEFLAQLAAELDPRSAVAVVAAMPTERVPEIAAAMAAQGEQVAMGRFVTHLDDETLAACIERMSDVDVLRVAFLSEGKAPHARLFDVAGAQRMRCVLSAASGAGLEDLAVYMREQLGVRRRKLLEAA